MAGGLVLTDYWPYGPTFFYCSQPLWTIGPDLQLPDFRKLTFVPLNYADWAAASLCCCKLHLRQKVEALPAVQDWQRQESFQALGAGYLVA